MTKWYKRVDPKLGVRFLEIDFKLNLYLLVYLIMHCKPNLNYLSIKILHYLIREAVI
jgi:hypothetical protein